MIPSPCTHRAGFHFDEHERPAISNACGHGGSSPRASKKRDAAETFRARQHEYETAILRGRQQQINRARVAVEAADAAYEAAKRDLRRLNDQAEEVVQAQVRAAYM